jgi:putative endonuclease
MEEAAEGFVYMLTNTRGNVLYVGSTSDLNGRVYCHEKRMIAGFTRKYNVSRLVYFERHESLELARNRERELKGKTRAKKDLLIKAQNPNFTEIIP